MNEGLRQIVTEPTRESNLLDLVMTDIPETVATVGGKIQDHKFVLTKFTFNVPESKFIPREVWNYSKADWRRLKDLLAEHDWEDLRAGSSSEAAAKVTETILDYAGKCIGKRVVRETKSTHPWMTEEVIEAIAKKKEA